MKLAIVLGTRPEIIKLSPVIRECTNQQVDFTLIHTGQHYSPNMDEIFFDELQLPTPDYRLELGQLDYRRRVGHGMQELMNIYQKEKVDCVIVQGDTLTVLLGALSANRMGLSVAHVEAGLRSHDLSMPEEVNRILTDHISTHLFPPTKLATSYLQEEGIQTETVGNTVVEAVKQNLQISQEKTNILERLGVSSKKYALVTSHRQENVDVKERLQGILEGIQAVAKDNPELTILFPIHPRTKKMMETFELEHPQEITFIDPVGYLDFLRLQGEARIILTDSGGIQEEASILHVPCVTLRDNTERPETVDAGMNILAGADAEKIREAAKLMLDKDIAWIDLYGDGKTSQRIITKLLEGAE